MKTLFASLPSLAQAMLVLDDAEGLVWLTDLSVGAFTPSASDPLIAGVQRVARTRRRRSSLIVVPCKNSFFQKHRIPARSQVTRPITTLTAPSAPQIRRTGGSS